MHSPSHITRWVIRFFALNWVLLVLLMSSYIGVLPHFHSIVFVNTRGIITALVFFVLAMTGQMALFCIAGVIVVQLFHLLFRNRWAVYSFGVLVGAIIVLAMSIDAVVYHLYHLHLAGIVWQIFRTGLLDEVVALSWVEYLFLAVVILVLLAVEVWLACLAHRYVRRHPNPHLPLGWMYIVAGLGLLSASYAMLLMAMKTPHKVPQVWSNNHLLNIEAQFVPYYENILGSFMGRRGFVRLETADAGIYIQASRVSRPLQYPLHPLACDATQTPHYNVLFIMLDAWRFDALTQTITPNMWQFAQKSWQFQKNSSGGNCTRPGIFSLFYSLPENYWDAFLSQRKGPVLIHQFLQEGYEMGVYRSASMHFPAFDQSVFREVPNLLITQKGKTAEKTDKEITREFLTFLQKRNQSKPFFGFLFYDSSHNYCEDGQDFPKPFQPAVLECDRLGLTRHTNPIPMINRYHNAVHFDDAQVGQVLDALEQQGLLKNTVVIIASDHGEEFNDNHLGYWGHASDYTPYQIHTPMVIYWPGQSPQKFEYPTTHYDIVPLLMHRVLGCTSPTSDYSVGADLMQPENRPFFIVNSYVDYAVLTEKSITRIYPEGNYAIQNRLGFNEPNAQLDVPVLGASQRQLHAYFKKKA